MAELDDNIFDRPVFVISSPRSGSTFLFEILAQAPDFFTVGGESHRIIEGLTALSMPARNWDSNRLKAQDATIETAAALRARFAQALRDRNGAAPASWPVRMLEKTPKNALRIPFLRAVFPQARFIYLYRNPRQVLASMMEAWESGRFRTYPGLPGWTSKLPWSLLLTPNWRELNGLPLNQIVAAQWAATTDILLDDLELIPPDRRTIAHYDRLVDQPEDEVRRLCRTAEIEWDRPLRGDLPFSQYTVSPPRAEKWRLREAEIEEVFASLQTVASRLERFVRQEETPDLS